MTIAARIAAWWRRTIIDSKTNIFGPDPDEDGAEAGDDRLAELVGRLRDGRHAGEIDRG